MTLFGYHGTSLFTVKVIPTRIEATKYGMIISVPCLASTMHEAGEVQTLQGKEELAGWLGSMDGLRRESGPIPKEAQEVI
jgi:hypothetical protein